MTGRFARLVRALWLRCPDCGKGRALVSWLKLRERCGNCGLFFERGEARDYWIGALAFRPSGPGEF